YVRGEIQRTEKDALVVPRSAALPNESREFEVFTVANNRAVKHTVKIGAENSQEMQVIADDLHPGDPIVRWAITSWKKEWLSKSRNELHRVGAQPCAFYFVFA